MKITNNEFDFFKEKIEKYQKKFVMESLLYSEEYRFFLDENTKRINASSSEAATEADVAFEIDYVLKKISENILEPIGFKGYNSRKERSVKFSDSVSTQFHFMGNDKKRGRIDSKINGVVLEYKHFSNYNTLNLVEKGREQVEMYLKGLYEEHNADYIAFVTDGIKCQIVEMKDGCLRSNALQSFDSNVLDLLVKSIINLSLQALTSENLIEDLVYNRQFKGGAVDVLTKSLFLSLKEMTPSTQISYHLWKDNFGLSHDDFTKQAAIEKRKKDLANIVGLDDIEVNEEYKILFALQTSVAILAILIAYKVVSVIKKDSIDYSLDGLLNLESQVACNELKNIANGNKSYNLGISNLLEIECFAWAFETEQWTSEIHNSINEIITILCKYENQPTLTERTDDLFRDLYMAIIPTSVRHSLGEYYTKKWLAHSVNTTALNNLPIHLHDHVNVIDPAGGSGTFILDFIHRKKTQYAGDENALEYILNEICLIDANILAVILARINFFIAISDLIKEEHNFLIPAYIGDSTISNMDKITEDGVCYIYKFPTRDEDVEFIIPTVFLENKNKFVGIMQDVEAYFQHGSKDEIFDKLCELCVDGDNEYIDNIMSAFVKLEEKGLINSSIINNISNYFVVCNLGRFDLVVGNPPWVDWKNLPSVHRDNIKNSCVSRELFSGDNRTGGINLNVCALLSNISAENWLKDDGVMALLMPQYILFQQSYEGYRKLVLKSDKQLYFQEIIDWSKSGHPFSPVQQLFATYIISFRKQDYTQGIPAKFIKLKKPFKLENISPLITEDNFENYFDTELALVGQTSSDRTSFSYAQNLDELSKFKTIAGECGYIGREGVEYYPQEVQLLNVTSIDKSNGLINIETYQNSKSKYSIPKRTAKLETKFLRPLVKGIYIKRFHLLEPEYVVAFPYNIENYKIPISALTLRTESRLLYEYYQNNRQYLDMQNKYSDKIINDNNADYYALARTGIYSHAPWYVVFRDNTKWVSTVVGEIETKWGGKKIPAFQNHCVSICENADNEFITENEAHYLCAILNTRVVEDFILATSDKRTFKIRLPFKIARYNEKDSIHIELSNLSKKAHLNFKEDDKIENFRNQMDELYIKSLLQLEDKNL